MCDTIEEDNGVRVLHQMFAGLWRHACLVFGHGAGWNYAWYRDTKDGLKELFPESKKSSNYKYRTNWITFYK